MFFSPESPKYLIEKGKGQQAAKSLQRLRGSHYDISEELKQLNKEVEIDNNRENASVRAIMSERIYFLPLVLMLLLVFLQQVSGVSFFFSYTQEIFEAAGTDMDPGTVPRSAIF